MSHNGQSVLVVEDERELNALVGAYVELCGYQYRAALNGATALQEAQARTPALVLLDLMLPDFDGFEVCARLKAAPETREIPIVMLTALCGDKNRERGLRCGAAEYLTKPFDPDKLMEAIARHARPPAGARSA
jgi:DNA-binding response OmpR family regulator